MPKQCDANKLCLLKLYEKHMQNIYAIMTKLYTTIKCNDKINLGYL